MVSPTFADDGLLLLQADRHLLRSTDAGQTWTTVALAGEKGTEAVAFSPSYATDRTIVASIAAIDMRDAPIVRPGTNEPDTEAGMLLSSDGGASWSPIALPSHDGTRVPRVTQIALSPTFAEDGTLFVEALDGWPQPYRDPVPTSAVFRSTDRGLHWEMISSPVKVEPEHKRYQTMVQLALSPSFAEDQTVLLGTRAETDAEHRDGQCWVQRSTDAGTTWGEKQPVEPIEGCGTLAIWQGSNWHRRRGRAQRLVRSRRDLAADRPAARHRGHGRPRHPPTIGQDGPVFVGLTHGGVLVLGSDAPPVRGHVDCAVPLADEVARVFDSDPWIRDRMGCPTGPAVQRTFAERRGKVRGQDARGIATEGYHPHEPGAPTSVTSSRPGRTERRTGPLALNVSFQVEAERPIPGAIQSFDDNGFAYILHDPGQPVEIVFGTGGPLGGPYRRVVVPD